MPHSTTTTIAFAGSGEEALPNAERADDARRESEEQLRVAIDAAALGTWDYYPKSGELRWSNRCKAMFGLPPEAPVNYDTFLAGLHPEDREKTALAVEHALDPKNSSRFHLEYRTIGLVDNVERWVYATGKAYSENGEVVRFIGTVEDISDRKYAEIDRDRFFSLGADFMVVASFDGFFRRISPNWEEVFGWTEAEFLSKDWLSFVHPDDIRATIKIAEGLRDGTEVVAFENRYCTKGGGYRWLSWKAKPYPEEKRIYAGATDITDRKQAEAVLEATKAESEARRMLYEAALSNTPDFVYIFAIDGRIIYANDALLTMWGIGDATGKTFLELGYPDWHAEMHEREILQVAETRKPLKGVIPFTGAHGTRIYEYIFSPVIGKEGEAVAVAGTTRDVTEHSETEREFRELADSMPQMIWVTRPDGFHEYYNKRWYEFTGVPEGSTDGESWNGMFHAEDRPRAWERWRRSLASGEPYEIEYRLRRHDGVYRWVLGRALPARDAEGNITKWYGTCTDIGEQLEREEMVRSVVESSPDCVKVLDLEGRLLSMNANGMRQMEIDDFNSCVNASWVGFWEGEHREKAAHAFAEAKQGRTARYEGLCNTGKGTPKWWEVIVTPISAKDGMPMRLLSISRDITERRQLVSQLEETLKIAEEARDRAEAANLAKSEFLATMSHEIRTPMNAVVGLSNILAASRPLTDQQKDFVETLQMSADALLSLINDLLDIAKIETRNVELEEIPFHLPRLVQEVVSMMAMRAQEKGLRFTMDAACAEGRTYLGDPTRLRQIILNLCSNAVKFTEAGGIDITIHCHDTAEPEIERIRIAVTDTGIGISPKMREEIFQKFVQADSSISRKYGGTGLGLSITKTLAEIMGGGIAVESEVGKGSTFTVEVQLRRTAEAHAAPKKHTAQAVTDPSRHARVLLVEDYAPNVLVATTFLKQFGYQYDVATSGQEALELIKAGDYAVVLMDVQMHGLNGFETTRLVREWQQQRKQPRLPIIGMTAHALTGDREHCLAAGMDDYISKPFDPDELKEKLSFYSALAAERLSG